MTKNSYILGVETSCDETSAAIINGNQILANIVSSQEIHEQFGGVVPELASRAHIRLITPIVEKAIREARITKNQLNGIAVTYGPGLVGALLVGLNFCKGLALAQKIPFIGINHIEGHIYGNFLSNPEITFPHLTLIVSGGHTQLVLMDKHLSYNIIGRTRDDAVGEAFDKGAKLLGLPYPGGPLIDEHAKNGNPNFHKFPRSFLKEDNFDFSYSGLKTALLVYLKDKTDKFIQSNFDNICASYQEAAVDVLVKKTIKAAAQHKVKSIGVVGGVAANSLLREQLDIETRQRKMRFFQPEFQFCTDNAAMIARAGAQRLSAGMKSEMSLNACPSLKLDQ